VIEHLLPPVKKFEELSDDELSRMDVYDLRRAYAELREHHIQETGRLLKKISLMNKIAENKTRVLDAIKELMNGF
jgi:hypothetical protein